MEQFQLHSFLHINGIGAASGLLYHHNLLYLISDNSTYLYAYKIDTHELTKIALTENPAENIPKKDKPDFESITIVENEIYIFGSGSTENRKKEVTFHLLKKTILEKSLENLYSNFIKIAQIKPEELNIEGSIILPTKTLFFQRGNSLISKNGIFTYFKNEITFKEIKLPKIKNVIASFTDAILVNEHIYFLASAEDTNSTYEDGIVMGSLIGQISIKTLEIVKTKIISETHKFEGITFFKETKNQLEFLLCEDNDTENLNSTIYKLTLYE